jgi:predicted transcriptional regulator
MTLNDVFRRFASSGADQLPGLGSLEKRVMRILWQGGEWSVRSMHEAFSDDLAYTTLMTTMDRLFRKGLLTRRKEGKAFLYSTVVTPNELRGGAVRGLLGSLLNTQPQDARPLLSCIVDAVGNRDRELLDDLQKLVQEKRREIEARSKK